MLLEHSDNLLNSHLIDECLRLRCKNLDLQLQHMNRHYLRKLRILELVSFAFGDQGKRIGNCERQGSFLQGSLKEKNEDLTQQLVLLKALFSILKSQCEVAKNHSKEKKFTG
jgi:hypothetical protein